MDYYQYTNKKIREGRNDLADQIKAYVYVKESAIFDFIEFNDDKVFLDPFLIGHYFQSLRKNEMINLISFLYGYHENKELQKLINLEFNKEGVAYIPNLGYLTRFNLNIKKFRRHGLISSDEINKNLISVEKIGKTEIEIYQTLHPFQEKLFKNIPIDESKYLESKFMKQLIFEKKIYIEKAFYILSEYFPEYYNQIMSVAKGIVLFRSSLLVSFASRTTPGISYFNVQEKDCLIYFIVEIAHQFGHNILYMMFYNYDQFFKVDENTRFEELVNKTTGRVRSIYSAFHGLYTTTQVAKTLEVLLTNITQFEREEQIEIIGRFVDNYRRFRTGLEKIESKRVYTDQGIKFYNILDKQCSDIYNKHNRLIDQIETKNQKFVYDHDVFLKENIYYCSKY